jgi:hypothetical protein
MSEDTCHIKEKKIQTRKSIQLVANGISTTGDGTPSRRAYSCSSSSYVIAGGVGEFLKPRASKN